MHRLFPDGRLLRLLQGDITRIAVDAIVNAANSALAGGGGVDGAIHRAGGPSIMLDLDSIRAASGGCPTGSAVATTAGNLPAKFVFHAVGPVYRDGLHGEPDLLASCYETAMRLAAGRALSTISFPSISTGVYAYPVEEAAPIAIAAIARHLEKTTTVREVIFVLFDDRTYNAYVHALE